MIKKILNLIFWFPIFLFTYSCGNQEEEISQEHYLLQGDTIVIPEGSNIKNQIKLHQVEKERYKLQLLSSGTVKAIPNFYAEIAPPFSGRVTKVFLKLGMKVHPGTPLFEMISPDFISIQKDYFAAQTEMTKSELNYNRQKELHKRGVGSLRDLEEAEAAYQIVLKEYENATAGLKTYNVQTNNLTLGQPLIITSPIEGVVIQNEIVNGHYIREDDEPHAKIADLKKVWVMGQVKEKDMHLLKDIQTAEIEISAYPEKKITGKIYHIEETVDEETRSVRVIIECDNKEQILKPGMFVNVRFTEFEQNVIFIPVKSVLQKNDQSFVFVQVEPHKFIRRYIETGITSESGNRILVISGLKELDKVVMEGGLYLLDAK